ncbi:MAG: hypothetical protein AAF705_21420 [Bacteroidota bacterium]
MQKVLILLILMAVMFSSCKQSEQSKPDQEPEKVETSPANPIQLSSVDVQPGVPIEAQVHTTYSYLDENEKGIIILNGYPKGGGEIEPGGIRGYNDHRGIHYGSAIYWSCFINQTDSPMELSATFPSDSFLVPNKTDAFYKLFLPSDTLEVERISLYNYGIEGLKTFLDENFDQGSSIQRNIAPGDSCYIYINSLMHMPNSRHGGIRSGFFLKGEELHYRFTINPEGKMEFACGSLVAME